VISLSRNQSSFFSDSGRFSRFSGEFGTWSKYFRNSHWSGEWHHYSFSTREHHVFYKKRLTRVNCRNSIHSDINIIDLEVPTYESTHSWSYQSKWDSFETLKTE